MKSIRKEEPQNNRVAWYNEQGQFHREDGPAIELDNGYKSWWINGKYHRLDGPALEYPDGNKYWYLNDQRHREDGPAVEHADGRKVWYYLGKHINCKTQEEFERLIKLMILW